MMSFLDRPKKRPRHEVPIKQTLWYVIQFRPIGMSSGQRAGFARDPDPDVIDPDAWDDESGAFLFEAWAQEWADYLNDKAKRLDDEDVRHGIEHYQVVRGDRVESIETEWIVRPRSRNPRSI